MSDSIVTARLVEAAFAIVEPTILLMMEAGQVKRRSFHIVVPVPRTAPSYSILYEKSIGKKEEWEASFDEIARSKSAITWRTGLSSSYIAHCAPHLLEMNDTIFWGSDILDELVTAGSGVEPYYDEMFSGMNNLAIRALCKHRHTSDVNRVREMGKYLLSDA